MQVLEKTDSPATTASSGGAELEELSLTVTNETLEALTKTKIIREEEKDGFQNYLISNSIGPGDILPVMARLRGIEEGEQISTVNRWARTITPIVKKRYSLVPFAGKLLGTSPLFKTYEPLREAAEMVKCPLIFSEDTDVLGFGTINPVAGARLAEHVTEYLRKETGVGPYISMFLLELPTWDTICRRQFEQ